MIKALAVLMLLVGGAAPRASGQLPGPDKVKHFLVSAFIQSTAFSVARAAGMDRPAAQAVGGATTMAVGFLKELHDRRTGGSFSPADLAWDAAGALAAAALLNGTR